jgi:hypothetical protein
MMKPDPVLGCRSFGHLARFVQERVSVMHFQICELENGGYKNVSEFEVAFIRLINSSAKVTSKLSR